MALLEIAVVTDITAMLEVTAAMAMAMSAMLNVMEMFMITMEVDVTAVV